MKNNFYIIFLLAAILIIDSFRILGDVRYLNVANSTYISTSLLYLSIIILIIIAKKEKFTPDTPLTVKKLYFFWLTIIIFNIVRGLLVAKNYWDWKFLMLASFGFSMIPLVFFLGKNIDTCKRIIKYTLLFLFPFGFLLIPLSLNTTAELYPRIMIMVSLFILFVPFVKTKWKILIIVVSIVGVMLAPGFRTNILKISLSYIVLLSYYFSLFRKNFLLKAINSFLFFIPIFLFITAIYFNFNIFDEITKLPGIELVDKTGKVQEMNSDTRTFLYAEVLSHLYYNSSFIFGEGSASYYETKAFYNPGDPMSGIRYGSEVGIINILLRYGLLGVIFYFLLLFNISKNAISHSNNDLAKLLGIFIALRWLISFIEEYTQYDINFFFFWLILGLVSSEKFRNMNNKEIKSLFS